MIPQPIPWCRGGLAAVALACCGLAAGPARAQSKGAAPKPAPISASSPAALDAVVKVVPTPLDPARMYFDLGVAAHDTGHLAEAVTLFQRAWGQKKSWDIAANLGIVLRKQGELLAAAEYLSYALRMLPPSEADTTRQGLERELTPTLAAVGRITLRCALPGAEVRVDGVAKGTTPLEGALFVLPGNVHIEVSKTGYDTAAQVVELKKGTTVETTLEPVPQRTPDERSYAPAVIGFSAGGAGLVLGAIAGVVSAVKLDQLRQTCGAELMCPSRLRGDVDAGRTAGNASTAGFVIAGIGAAVGVTLLIVPPKKSSARAVAVAVGPTFVGLEGAF